MKIRAVKTRDQGFSQTAIRNKLSRKMTLQACLIALVAVLSIGFASVVIEQFLVREALSGEAQHFWANYQTDKGFPTPNTDNLKGFLSMPSGLAGEVISGLPESLQSYSLGYHKIGGQTEHSLLYISEREGLRLALLFDGHSVFRLAVYFGVIPLMFVLVLIYVAAWWVYRESTHLTSPIVWLAHKFDRFDPADPHASLQDLSDIPGDVDWEIDRLVHSLSSYSRRIKHFVDRERTFTRDASHEFRTPLTVIKMASDLLLAGQDLDPRNEKFALRIKAAVLDMEELIEAFLILARETENEFEHEQVNLYEVVEQEVAAARLSIAGKQVKIEIEQESSLLLNTSRKIVGVVVANLIRNAVLYTPQGRVVVRITGHSVIVQDTGIGMSEEQLKKVLQPFYRAEQTGDGKGPGFGVGLAIVNRLCSRFNWQLQMSSELGKGTSMEVVFLHNG